MAAAGTISLVWRKSTAGLSTAGGEGRLDQAVRPLRKDRRNTRNWFNEHDDTEHKAKAPALAHNNSSALIFHVQIEEKIFFPMVRESAGRDMRTEESKMHHPGCNQLIIMLRAGNVGRCTVGAKISVLDQYIHQRMLEEEFENRNPQ